MSADDSFSPVDRLEFTVLVDNALEWMTALPPGFTNEVRLQLQNGLPRDIETGVPILDLPHFCCGAHGLSILVTTERDGQRRTLLFDTGPDGSALERNLSALKISANDIDTIVLSHWHSDHTGGLLTALSHIGKDKGKSCVVDAHASYPSARGILPPGATEVLARLPADPTFEEIQRIGTTLRTYQGGDGHATLGGTAWVSGEIPRQFEWESGLKGSVRWNPVERAWHPDELILDERYLVVDVRDKGLVIFSSCSHAGICNVVADASLKFSGRPIHMIVGGLHLAGPELEYRIQPTVEYLVQATPDFVVPVHCTGLRAKVALANAFGTRCVAGGAGIRVSVPP